MRGAGGDVRRAQEAPRERTRDGRRGRDPVFHAMEEAQGQNKRAEQEAGVRGLGREALERGDHPSRYRSTRKGERAIPVSGGESRTELTERRTHAFRSHSQETEAGESS